MGFKSQKEELVEKYLAVKNEFNRQLKECSTFDRKEILRVFCDIIAAFKGDVHTFIYYTEINYFPLSVIFCSDDYDLDMGFKTSIIDLEKSGKALFLSAGKYTMYSQICFYDLNFITINYDSPADFSSFPYLEEFINEVISYRMENGLNEGIILKQLEELKNKFLAEKLGEERETVSDGDIASKKLVTQEGK